MMVEDGRRLVINLDMFYPISNYGNILELDPKDLKVLLTKRSVADKPADVLVKSVQIAIWRAVQDFDEAKVLNDPDAPPLDADS